jgi:hypothetical protein
MSSTKGIWYTPYFREVGATDFVFQLAPTAAQYELSGDLRAADPASWPTWRDEFTSPEMSDNSKKTTQPPLDMGSDTVEGGYGSIWGRFGSGTRVAGPLGSDGSCDDIEGPPSSMATSVRRGGGTWLSSGVRRPFCGGEIVDGSQTPRRYPDTRFPSRRASRRSSNGTWGATDLEVWYAIEPSEPGEKCSRDKACKLANGEVSAAVGWFFTL